MIPLPDIGVPDIAWRDLADIAIATFVLYRLLMLIRGTRAISVIWGIMLILAAYYLTDYLELVTVNWLLANFLGSIVLIVIILFQRDLKKGLAQMGANLFFRHKGLPPKAVAPILDAVTAMAARRVGAIIAIERNVPLGDVVERGVEIDAPLSSELLQNIFHPGAPLHDGAVIVKGARIAAAGAILPLPPGAKADAVFGTRHQAALGLSEETDAVVLVVSEERAQVSVARAGKLTAAADRLDLERLVEQAWKK